MGEWKRGPHLSYFGRGHGTAEGDVASANTAARTSVGHTLAVLLGGEEEGGPPPRTGHEMAAGIIASMGKSAQAVAGDDATEEG